MLKLLYDLNGHKVRLIAAKNSNGFLYVAQYLVSDNVVSVVTSKESLMTAYCHLEKVIENGGGKQDWQAKRLRLALASYSLKRSCFLLKLKPNYAYQLIARYKIRLPPKLR
ncbi:DNA ligase-like domain-containing protein [Lacticaseibacillus saniviri]|uniref:hypothetical protein n=1 Tax=Lacticaseibacillus saniviri TaxID=931533 RepID=UPI001F158E10|nr:hypothetical protein [Lacticaseibacillus saniviri]